MARTDHPHRRNRKVYGPAKRLEMARSVLPSTWRRQAAQELARVRRANRAAVARDLRRYTGDADAAVARFVDDALDITRYPSDELKEIVCDRRDADKLNPFQRWAVEKTRDLPIEERLDAIRDVLPRDLIGRHALSHVRAMNEFRWMDHDYWWWGLDAEDDEADDAAERERVIAEVSAALRDGRHREVNATMRANADFYAYFEDADRGWVRNAEGRCYRPLGGESDVEAFVDNVLGARYRCRGQAIALRRFTGELR